MNKQSKKGKTIHDTSAIPIDVAFWRQIQRSIVQEILAKTFSRERWSDVQNTVLYETARKHIMKSDSHHQHVEGVEKGICILMNSARASTFNNYSPILWTVCVVFKLLVASSPGCNDMLPPTFIECVKVFVEYQRSTILIEFAPESVNWFQCKEEQQQHQWQDRRHGSTTVPAFLFLNWLQAIRRNTP